MTAQVLFFSVFSETDPHSLKVECVYTFFDLKKTTNKKKKTRTKKAKETKEENISGKSIKNQICGRPGEDRLNHFSKMKMTIKNRLHRRDIIRPWSIHEH